jgi:carbohydrate-binding DOMON domain-containing protein
MFTANQIVAHLVGDYILQSHWMATRKTSSSLAAGAHAITYTLPFALLAPSTAPLLAIAITHFVIDRWRLARFVVWAKNGARGPVTSTGYADEVPAWLAVWLFVIADNTLHVLCNGTALAIFAGGHR